jgi:hypothetical protein
MWARPRSVRGTAARSAPRGGTTTALQHDAGSAQRGLIGAPTDAPRPRRATPQARTTNATGGREKIKCAPAPANQRSEDAAELTLNERHQQVLQALHQDRPQRRRGGDQAANRHDAANKDGDDVTARHNRRCACWRSVRRPAKRIQREIGDLRLHTFLTHQNHLVASIERPAREAEGQTLQQRRWAKNALVCRRYARRCVCVATTVACPRFTPRAAPSALRSSTPSCPRA